MESSYCIGEVVKCKHGLIAVERTSWSESDPARRYFGCPNMENDVCDFNVWIDPNVTDVQRQYIEQLRSERDLHKEALLNLTDEYRRVSQSESIAMNIAAQCRKERDDLQQQLRVKDFDCRQLKQSEERAVAEAGQQTIEIYEMKQDLDALKTEIWWKNYAIAALIVTLIVVAH